MATRVIEGTEAVRALEGEHLGHSDWLEITQERVDRFADATLDHQWIHVDPERARRESPFRGPIAHGYLTLSLVPHLFAQVLEVTGVRLLVNYGLNKLRFPAPVPVGAKVRLGVQIQSVEAVTGGIQCVFLATTEVQGADKPAMVAEVVFRYFD